MMDSIYFWAHMLDESKHASYYEVYIQEHPEDKLYKLIDSMISEFADSLKKDNIDLHDCIQINKLGEINKLHEILACIL